MGMLLLELLSVGALLGARIATRGQLPIIRMVTLEPRQLTGEITKANSSAALLALWSEHRADFNTLHISAFWNRLGKLVRFSRAEQGWLRSNAEAMVPVREQTLVMLPQLGARSLCNTAHGLASARIHGRPPWSDVWEGISKCAREHEDVFQPQNLANLAGPLLRADTPLHHYSP